MEEIYGLAQALTTVVSEKDACDNECKILKTKCADFEQLAAGNKQI